MAGEMYDKLHPYLMPYGCYLSDYLSPEGIIKVIRYIYGLYILIISHKIY